MKNHFVDNVKLRLSFYQLINNYIVAFTAFTGLIRGILVGILLTTMFQLSNGQVQNEIDSILQRVNSRVYDSSRVKDLFQIGTRYISLAMYEEAKDYLTRSWHLAEQSNQKHGVASALSHLGRVYEGQGNNVEALKIYRAGLKAYEDIGDDAGIAASQGNLGLIYWQLGEYDKALQSHMLSMVMYDQQCNKLGMARAYNNIGLIYDFKGNYPAALQNYLEALKIAEETEFKPGIAYCNTNIGMVHSYQKNYSEALQCHQTSLNIYEEMGEKSGVADALCNMAEIYIQQKNYDKALNNASTGLQLAKEIGYKSGIAVGYDITGQIHLEQNLFAEALQNFSSALSLWEEMGNRQKIANSCKNLGITNNKLHQYHKAKQYLTRALNIAKEIEAKGNLKEVYRALSEADEGSGNYQNALFHFQLYANYQDSLLNEKSTKELAVLKEQYAAEKKDKEIELLNKEKVIQTLDLKKQKQAKNYLLASLGFFGILSFFVYRNYATRQELKLQTIRNKIASDLHDDVGSTLSSISIFSQMAQAQFKEKIPALETIGESSRKMLDAMTDIVWAINPDNDEMEKIIMRMRTFVYELLGAKQIEYEFSVDDDIFHIKLPMEARKNIYLIFKEATNNMVKYAHADKAMFSIKNQKDKFIMLIRDNGKGFDPNIDSSGNGLKNMKKRAAEIGARFQIDSIPGSGTTIKLELAA